MLTNPVHDVLSRDTTLQEDNECLPQLFDAEYGTATDIHEGIAKALHLRLGQVASTTHLDQDSLELCCILNGTAYNFGKKRKGDAHASQYAAHYAKATASQSCITI